MPYSLDEALQDADLTVVERNDAWGSYTVRIGSLSTPVHIALSRSPISDETGYTRTHDMQSPQQLSPYHQSRLFWDDPGYALFQAINSLTEYYRLGVANNHLPQESWLVRTNREVLF